MKVGIVGNMTKLEQKLIELGYIGNGIFDWYFKLLSNGFEISISINDNELKGKVWNKYRYYDRQQDIDNLQQAFDELQKDLEELKKV